MNRKLFTLLAFIVLASLLAGCATRGQLRERDAEIASLKEQLTDAQNQCVILENEKKEVEDRVKALEGELNQLSSKLKIEMEQNEKYTMLRVPEKLLFKSSQVKLSGNGKTVLNDIADILAKYTDFDIRVEGHTDNRPIKPEFYDKFKSNWELSTARATEVLRYLVHNKKISPDRMIAVGYGEFRPIADNGTTEGRSQNRRVEFFIAPNQKVKDLTEK